ncbi:unnamed protein product [Discosporangium mesarthrocarpum]
MRTSSALWAFASTLCFLREVKCFTCSYSLKGRPRPSGSHANTYSRGYATRQGKDTPFYQRVSNNHVGRRVEWCSSLFAVPTRDNDSRDTRWGFEVDNDIEVGNIDKELVEAIAPALKVLGNVVELLDTTDRVFTFKYMGFIKHKYGIECWARKLIKETYPDAQDVKFVTNRVRDHRDSV